MRRLDSLRRVRVEARIRRGEVRELVQERLVVLVDAVSQRYRVVHEDPRDDLELEWPIARIDGGWLTFGFDEHLGLAARIAVDGMLDLLEREHGLSRPDALGLASVVVDLRVTQVVNQTLGVHAVLRDDAWLDAPR